MSKICLVRHGETDWNAQGKLQGREDIPLNQKGKQQAKELSLYLRELKWDMIVSSPLKRAKETAEIINIYWESIPLIEMEDFIEQDYGEASGLTVVERNELYPDGKYPNQESRENLSRRSMNGIERVRKKFPNKNVLLVAHGGVINSILATLSKGKIGSGKTKLINACLNNIQFQNEKWIINNYNIIALRK